MNRDDEDHGGGGGGRGSDGFSGSVIEFVNFNKQVLNWI